MAEKSEQRNYAIDVLRILFAFAVVFCHTSAFVTADTTLVNNNIMHASGWIGVHFFYIVSGMLMVVSFMKHGHDTTKAGREALDYVLKKFRGMAWWYWVSLALGFTLYIWNICMTDEIGFSDLFYAVLKDIPEALCISETGYSPLYINPTWYISAMLLVMLPTYYLLVKNRQLLLYVLAPLTALFSLGFMYHQKNPLIPVENKYINDIPNSIIRAVCGICFGIIAYNIYLHIYQRQIRTLPRILLTMCEAAIYALQIGAIFVYPDRYNAVFTCLILLPVAVAITFSGQSYISLLFRSKIFRHAGTWSLAVYLNHAAAIRLTVMFFPGRDYKGSVYIMLMLTVVMCFVCYGSIRLLKLIWSKWLRRFFVAQQTADTINDK